MKVSVSFRGFKGVSQYYLYTLLTGYENPDTLRVRT